MKELGTHYTGCIENTDIFANDPGKEWLKNYQILCRQCKVNQNNREIKCSKFKFWRKNSCIGARIEFREKDKKQKWPHNIWLESGAPCTEDTKETQQFYEEKREPCKLPPSEIIGIYLSQFGHDPLMIFENEED